MSRLEDAAVLCVTELVSNVVRHTDSEDCIVMVKPADDSVSIEVIDHSPDAVHVEAPDPDAEGGRGLRIVDALSDAWGVRDVPDNGKVVWLRLC